MKFTRTWAMASGDTFTIKPIKEFVVRHLTGVSVDPFARNNELGFTYSNDLNPNTKSEYHMDCVDFLAMLVSQKIKVDTIIFDPPYSPRQISELYKEIGVPCTMKSTQDSVMRKQCRNLFNELAHPGTVALSFGWNSTGMGRMWTMKEIMLCCHGGAKNDTICVAQYLDTLL